MMAAVVLSELELKHRVHCRGPMGLRYVLLWGLDKQLPRVGDVVGDDTRFRVERIEAPGELPPEER